MSTLTLGNGLRVMLVRDPLATEVQVTSVYGVGAADDPAGKEGMAHLVEHLMFQQILGSQTLFAQLESTATYFNAFTTYDTTSYVARAAPGQLEKLLTIEGIRVGLRCTSINEAQFLRERDVVLNELRQRDFASEVVQAVYAGVFAPGHPYRRRGGGTVETVSSITFAEACAFVDAHYATPNEALVISGNVTPEQAQSGLARMLVRVAKRPFTARVPVGQAQHPGAVMTVKVPVSDHAVLFAWPLPTDPLAATRSHAVASAVVSAIDGQVAGRVTPVFLGDERVPLFGVVIEPGKDETFEQIVEGTRIAVDELVPLGLRQSHHFFLDDLEFDNVRQSAIYALYANLESDSGRDARFASYLLAGRDPREALAGEFEGLREMTYDNAAQLATDTFSYKHAIVVKLEPGERVEGTRLSLAPAAHDHGPTRELPDPALAHQPAELAEALPGTTGMESRTLPNGMRVVLLPLTSVPTVEVRLIIGAGTADETAAQRGAALLAAHGLTFDVRHVNDVLSFVAAGGQRDINVGPDHSTFTVRGVNMHIDFLLAGLRRWVRDGVYEDSADAAAKAMRSAGKKIDDDSKLTEA